MAVPEVPCADAVPEALERTMRRKCHSVVSSASTTEYLLTVQCSLFFAHCCLRRLPALNPHLMCTYSEKASASAVKSSAKSGQEPDASSLSGRT